MLEFSNGNCIGMSMHWYADMLLIRQHLDMLQAKEMDLLAEVTKDLFAIDRDEMLFNQIRLYGK